MKSINYKIVILSFFNITSILFFFLLFKANTNISLNDIIKETYNFYDLKIENVLNLKKSNQHFFLKEVKSLNSFKELLENKISVIDIDSYFVFQDDGKIIDKNNYTTLAIEDNTIDFSLLDTIFLGQDNADYFKWVDNKLFAVHGLSIENKYYIFILNEISDTYIINEIKNYNKILILNNLILTRENLDTDNKVIKKSLNNWDNSSVGYVYLYFESTLFNQYFYNNVTWLIILIFYLLFIFSINYLYINFLISKPLNLLERFFITRDKNNLIKLNKFDNNFKKITSEVKNEFNKEDYIEKIKNNFIHLFTISSIGIWFYDLKKQNLIIDTKYYFNKIYNSSYSIEKNNFLNMLDISSKTTLKKILSSIEANEIIEIESTLNLKINNLNTPIIIKGSILERDENYIPLIIAGIFFDEKKNSLDYQIKLSKDFDLTTKFYNNKYFENKLKGLTNYNFLTIKINNLNKIEDINYLENRIFNNFSDKIKSLFTEKSIYVRTSYDTFVVLYTKKLFKDLDLESINKEISKIDIFDKTIELDLEFFIN